MMLLIFICPVYKTPHSARRGATKASELFGGGCRPLPPFAQQRRREGRGARGGGRAPSASRERGLAGPAPRVAGPRGWPSGHASQACTRPLPPPRAQGRGAFRERRRPPRPHRLNHCGSIYWEQINSPFWKRFNCGLHGWGAVAGGCAGPRGKAPGGACGCV